MTVGGDNRMSAPLVHGRVTAQERYFADFETYLVALHGFALVAEAATSGTASMYRASDAVTLGCKQSPEQWVWIPALTVALLARNISPLEAALERIHCRLPAPNERLNLGALETLLYNFGQALATNFYERHRSKAEAKFGTNPASWPSVWNFGRVVRNAMSHGGKIDIRNANAVPVQWRGLRYSSSDNGRQVLHTDLWPGDLFNLILEMDAYL
jgi:hypothetical protein